MIKARNDSKRVKENLQKATHEYDELYVQAQEFLRNCDDRDKCAELLAILDQTDEDRESEQKKAIMAEKKAEKAIERKPNQMQMQAHLGPGIVQGLKKYQNVKL